MAMRPVERQETVGPSWSSVQELVATITNHHKVLVLCETKWSASRGAGVHTWWTVAAYRVDGAGQRDHLRAVVRGWPHADHKTVPGMLTGMLYELDEKLAGLVWKQSEVVLA